MYLVFLFAFAERAKMPSDLSLLHTLSKFSAVIAVPVLDWAPFGLSQRFATLYASALWNLVQTFDTSDVSLQMLHALLVLYLPALILHDARSKTNDTSDGPCCNHPLTSSNKQSQKSPPGKQGAPEQYTNPSPAAGV